MRNFIKKPKPTPVELPKPQASLGDRYSVGDLIRVTGLSRNTIYGHIATGTIRSTRFGRLIVITPEEVARILREGLPTLRQPYVNVTSSDPLA